MTPDSLRRDEAARWLRQAAKDLNAARLLTQAEPSRSLFHSQQACEKACKGLLAWHNVPFRRTHDLADLGAQRLTVAPSLEPVLREAADLTDYASAFRYPPEAPYEPDVEEARQGLAVAERLGSHVAALLPGADAA